MQELLVVSNLFNEVIGIVLSSLWAIREESYWVVRFHWISYG